jgi:hypothetical protein
VLTQDHDEYNMRPCFIRFVSIRSLAFWVLVSIEEDERMKSLCLAAFVIFAIPGVGGAQHLKVTYKPLQNDDGSKALAVSWVAAFNAVSPSISGVAQNRQCNNCPISIDSASIRAKSTVVEGVITETTFSAMISYGATGDLLSDGTQSIDLIVKASRVQAGGAPIGDPFEAMISPSLEAIRDFFNLKDQNKDLAAELVRRPPIPVPARLHVRQVSAVTDRTIKVRLNADQTIRVDVLAYQTSDVTQAAGRTDFSTLDQLLPANEDKEITISQLIEDQPYIVKIKERAAASATGRALIDETITQGPAGLLRTKRRIDLPTISPIGSPVQKRNDAVHVAFSARNASSVVALVEAFNARGEIYQVSKETSIPTRNDPSDSTRYEGDIPIAAGIQEGVTYRVRFRALNVQDDLSTAGDNTYVFTGKSAKLFDVVELQITTSTFKFIPTNASSTVQTNVSIALNQRPPLTLQCNQPSSTPSSTLSPVCEINVAALLSLLTPTPPTPGSTPAAAATPNQPSKLTFIITVKDPETERTQSSTFAIGVTPPDTSTSNGQRMLNNVKSFVQSVVTGGSNNKLEPTKIQGSGIAGFLGALLRGFIAL